MTHDISYNILLCHKRNPPLPLYHNPVWWKILIVGVVLLLLIWWL